MYDPGTDTWRTLATASVTRMYHSVALLLPDGRVVTAGGNPKQGTHVEWDHDPNEEMKIEIYSPPYLFKGPRPTITSAPSTVQYGASTFVATPDAAGIASVSLVQTCASLAQRPSNGSPAPADVAMASAHATRTADPAALTAGSALCEASPNSPAAS